MLFCLLNDSWYPCPRTHALHVRKLAEGFVQRGYHFRQITVSELQYLSKADIVYVSNHFTTEPMHRPASRWLARRLVRFIRNCEAQVVLWSFHTAHDWIELVDLGERVLHLGEDLYDEAVRAEPTLHEFRSVFDVLAVRYSSPMHPHLSSRVRVDKCYDFNFVGHPYQREITRHCERRYRAFVRNVPPVISEPLRVNSFRRAEVNLAFHAASNIRKGIVVERFAEALSFGGIVFHDHPRIVSEFPGLSSLYFVDSAAGVDLAFREVLGKTLDERDAMRAESWEAWVKAGLSYFHQAGRILAALGLPVLEGA